MVEIPTFPSEIRIEDATIKAPFDSEFWMLERRHYSGPDLQVRFTELCFKFARSQGTMQETYLGFLAACIVYSREENLALAFPEGWSPNVSEVKIFTPQEG